MNSKPLALITGFGGINSAGRSSSHLSYKNLIFGSLNEKEQLETKRIASKEQIEGAKLGVEIAKDVFKDE